MNEDGSHSVFDAQGDNAVQRLSRIAVTSTKNYDLFQRDELVSWYDHHRLHRSVNRQPRPADESIFRIAQAIQSNESGSDEWEAYFRKALRFLDHRRMSQQNSWMIVLEAACMTIEESLNADKVKAQSSPVVAVDSTVALASTDVPMSNDSTENRKAETDKTQQSSEIFQQQQQPAAVEEIIKDDHELDCPPSSHPQEPSNNQPSFQPSLRANSVINNSNSQDVAIDPFYRFYQKNEIMDALLTGLLGKVCHLTEWCQDSRFIRFKQPNRIPSVLTEQIDHLLRWGVYYSSLKAFVDANHIMSSSCGTSTYVQDIKGELRCVIGYRHSPSSILQAPGLTSCHYDIISARRSAYLSPLKVQEKDEFYLGPLSGDNGPILGNSVATNPLDRVATSRPDQFPLVALKGGLYQMINQYASQIQTEWESILISLHARCTNQDEDPLSTGVLYLGLIDLADQVKQACNLLNACQFYLSNDLPHLLYSLIDSSCTGLPVNGTINELNMEIVKIDWIDLYHRCIDRYYTEWESDSINGTDPANFGHHFVKIESGSYHLDMYLSCPQLPTILNGLEHELTDTIRLANAYRHVTRSGVPKINSDLNIGKIKELGNQRFTWGVATNLIKSITAFREFLLNLPFPGSSPYTVEYILGVHSRILSLVVKTMHQHTSASVVDYIRNNSDVISQCSLIFDVLFHENPIIHLDLLQEIKEKYGYFIPLEELSCTAFEIDTKVSRYLTTWWHNLEGVSKKSQELLMPKIEEQSFDSDQQMTSLRFTLESLRWDVKVEDSLLFYLLSNSVIEGLQEVNQLRHSLFSIICSLSSFKVDTRFFRSKNANRVVTPETYKVILIAMRLRANILHFLRQYDAIIRNILVIPSYEKMIETIKKSPFTVSRIRCTLDEIVGNLSRRLRDCLSDGPIWRCFTESQYAAHLFDRFATTLELCYEDLRIPLTDLRKDYIDDQMLRYYQEFRMLRDSWESDVEEYLWSMDVDIENAAPDVVMMHQNLLKGAYFDLTGDHRVDVRRYEDL